MLFKFLERLAREKHWNLLGPFLSYKENESVVNMIPSE
jgi:hypothetical protein